MNYEKLLSQLTREGRKIDPANAREHEQSLRVYAFGGEPVFCMARVDDGRVYIGPEHRGVLAALDCTAARSVRVNARSMRRFDDAWAYDLGNGKCAIILSEDHKAIAIKKCSPKEQS